MTSQEIKQSNTTRSSASSSIGTITTLLIANRGEIACRVMSTAKAMGLRTVAVYSEADVDSLHVAMADSAVCIGPAQPAQSYLNIEAVISAAVKSGADAIHPGYGFLSENPAFAEACVAANIVFVGPDPQSMRSMGLKDAAKALMEAAGVPVVPGYHGDNQDIRFLAQQAEKIGYPVLIKARAGGGGKGMRRVDAPEEFISLLEAAQREGAASFGDSAVLIEKYIEHPRHIEVQVFGDRHGQCVHLFERDCSLQRRHQKVIEEAPAPGMTKAVRDAMTDAAIRCAQSVNYVGAGTVEFIVDASGALRADGFWFMEMNTRLQVEHPVTEAITGVDLVQWQLLIAAGHPLPLKQDEIKLQGHSVEARLYAEDVAAGFLPATGTLHRYSLYDEIGLIYSGVQQGDVVQPYYDPMLAKLISHGRDRSAAFKQLHRMLDQSVILGVTTNRAFLASLCVHEEVIEGRVHTGLIEADALNSASQLADDGLPTSITLNANLALAAVVCANRPVSGSTFPCESSVTVFERLGAWQLWGSPIRNVSLLANNETLCMIVERVTDTHWCVRLKTEIAGSGDDSEPLHVVVQQMHDLANGTRIQVGGLELKAIAITRGQSIFCRAGTEEAHFIRPAVEQGDGAVATGKHLLAPMPGRIIAVKCGTGDSVSKGDVLMTLEAMKMEHNLIAVADAVIETVLVEFGDQVEQGMPLLVFDGDQ